jgi:hypothetical protein
LLPSAEAASDTQQPAGDGKKEKERQRKERQRQRKMEEAWEALQVAMEAMLDARCVSPLWLMCIGRCPGEAVASMCGWQGALTCHVCGCSGESGLLGAVEKATVEAEKHGDRSEKLSALVAAAKTMLEQAKTEKAERARAAAAEAAAAASVKAAAEAAEAAERLQLEEELAALTLSAQSSALRMQQVQARLGVPPAAPNPDAEETQCVVCMDAPKNRVVLPCMHMCVCEACAQLLRDRCPVCRGPIERIAQLFT